METFQIGFTFNVGADKEILYLLIYLYYVRKSYQCYKNNNDINGIKIDYIESLVSQYADDTSLLSDSSARCLRNTMLVLKFYANISGLNIDIDKTKAIWIGAYKDRRDTLCLA